MTRVLVQITAIAGLLAFALLARAEAPKKTSAELIIASPNHHLVVIPSSSNKQNKLTSVLGTSLVEHQTKINISQFMQDNCQSNDNCQATLKLETSLGNQRSIINRRPLLEVHFGKHIWVDQILPGYEAMLCSNMHGDTLLELNNISQKRDKKSQLFIENETNKPFALTVSTQDKSKASTPAQTPFIVPAKGDKSIAVEDLYKLFCGTEQDCKINLVYNPVEPKTKMAPTKPKTEPSAQTSSHHKVNKQPASSSYQTKTTTAAPQLIATLHLQSSLWLEAAKNEVVSGAICSDSGSGNKMLTIYPMH